MSEYNVVNARTNKPVCTRGSRNPRVFLTYQHANKVAKQKNTASKLAFYKVVKF